MNSCSPRTSIHPVEINVNEIVYYWLCARNCLEQYDITIRRIELLKRWWSSSVALFTCYIISVFSSLRTMFIMASCLSKLLSAISALPPVFWSRCVLIESESKQSESSLIAALIGRASSFIGMSLSMTFQNRFVIYPWKGICLGMLVQGKKSKIKLNCNKKKKTHKCTQNNCWF